MSDEPIQVARRNLEAFNAADWGAFSADLSMDSVYEEPATGRVAKGIAEITDLAKGWKEGFPDVKGTITNQVASGDWAVLEITWVGKQTGDLVSPMGTIPATGRSVTIRSVEVIEAKNGKLASTRHYFDLAGMMAQLGVGAGATA